MAVVAMQALIAMIVLYMIRLTPAWAALPLMALAGIPMACASVEENLPLTGAAYLAVVLFGLIVVAGFPYLCAAIVFFLPYPLLKPLIDTHGDGFIRWTIKMVWFCGAMYWVSAVSSTTVLLPYLEHVPVWGMVPGMLILFLLYDYLLFLFARWYAFHIRRHL